MPTLSVLIISVAAPDARIDVPRATVPSKNVTVPAGVAPSGLVTVAVIVTGAPRFAVEGAASVVDVEVSSSTAPMSHPAPEGRGLPR